MTPEFRLAPTGFAHIELLNPSGCGARHAVAYFLTGPLPKRAPPAARTRPTCPPRARRTRSSCLLRVVRPSSWLGRGSSSRECSSRWIARTRPPTRRGWRSTPLDEIGAASEAAPPAAAALSNARGALVDGGHQIDPAASEVLALSRKWLGPVAAGSAISESPRRPWEHGRAGGAPWCASPLSPSRVIAGASLPAPDLPRTSPSRPGPPASLAADRVRASRAAASETSEPSERAGRRDRR